MPREFARTRRLGQQIKREIAELIRSEIQDPRVGMASVTDVEVSRDFSHARVHVSVLEIAGDPTETLQALNNAAGFLRGKLGSRLRARIVPKLRFVEDRSLQDGMRLESLIDDAVASDRDAHDADSD